MSGSRWIFAADGSAVQVCNIVRLTVSRSGVHDKPYGVMAKMLGNDLLQIATYDTKIEAEEAIKDMVVGREHRRAV
jgi:hypothetical protein